MKEYTVKISEKIASLITSAAKKMDCDNEQAMFKALALLHEALSSAKLVLHKYNPEIDDFEEYEVKLK